MNILCNYEKKLRCFLYLFAIYSMRNGPIEGTSTNILKHLRFLTQKRTLIFFYFFEPNVTLLSWNIIKLILLGASTFKYKKGCFLQVIIQGWRAQKLCSSTVSLCFPHCLKICVRNWQNWKLFLPNPSNYIPQEPLNIRLPCTLNSNMVIKMQILEFFECLASFSELQIHVRKVKNNLLL